MDENCNESHTYNFVIFHLLVTVSDGELVSFLEKVFSQLVALG